MWIKIKDKLINTNRVTSIGKDESPNESGDRSYSIFFCFGAEDYREEWYDASEEREAVYDRIVMALFRSDVLVSPEAEVRIGKEMKGGK